MNKELRKLYGSSYIDEIEHYDFNTYYYFKSIEHLIFGIEKNAVSSNELVLLDMHYERLDDRDFTDRDIEVLEYLLGEGSKPDKDTYNKLKYILMKPLQYIERETLSELLTLMHDFLGPDTLIFKRESVIIVITPQELTQDIGDFVDSITSDFYVDLFFYESDLSVLNEELKQVFMFEFESFIELQKTTKSRVTRADLMYNNIVNVMDATLKDDFKKYVLGDFVTDKEMLNMIKTFFETNMNVSLSAKNCFMHRNTFQNKIEKFIQTTGFNIKKFDDAFIVYLALSI
ncbi:helix-turn-helix domain-containing protein [Haloplasma contractile]|uniref:DNA-binding protein Fis family protein n=1 Tax=Haloplasma contractile SSD-17B TaxID=1033810 RepID=U2FJZ8_9MOLU|nr:helix-turn-helix domain-containing protein [Haloplasma contractile]ERJ11554.1 DNA-binding protein Fis family protein [Haloplasma contractile SSD-17B]